VGNKVTVGLVALAIGVGGVGCSSSSTTSSGTSSGTAGGGATTTRPTGATTPSSAGGSSGSIPTAAELQQVLGGEGLTITAEQAQCISSAVTKDPALGVMFGNKGAKTTANAEAFVKVLITCYGSQQALGQAFVGVFQKQTSDIGSAEATCLGTALGPMSTSDLGAIFANEQSSISSAGQAALTACAPKTSTTM